MTAPTPAACGGGKGSPGLEGRAETREPRRDTKLLTCVLKHHKLCLSLTSDAKRCVMQPMEGIKKTRGAEVDLTFAANNISDCADFRRENKEEVVQVQEVMQCTAVVSYREHTCIQ